MDGESSYESDISESWSLIDINLNEESLTAAEAYSELERSSQSDLKTGKLKVENETDLEDFVRKCKEVNKSDFSRISDSDSDVSFQNQGLPINNRTETDGIDSPLKRSSDNDGLHDSGDAESIEILDIDDSEIDRLEVSGVNHLDFPTYQSDDEESLEGKSSNENSNNSTVIKRRRRRVNRSSEDTVHSVNSENRSSAENSSTPDSIDTKKESPTLSEEVNHTDGHPVYKHYRNNVANTILSLTVAVIFAGVACIAIGHFLGVQDAAETAVELVETLKKLRVENAALQSRLSHLNRALLTREMNSKLELPLNQPNKEAPSERSCADPSNSNEISNINNAALSEIRSSLNSIEWLSTLQNFVHKNNRVTDTENGLDFSGIGKFIHDQLHTLNTRQEEGAKFLKDSDRKISKVLQKIINRLSSSQDHIEKLYERLIKLKNKLNHKIKRIFPESAKEIQLEKSRPRNRVPVTELDLQTMDWNSNNEIDKQSDEVDAEEYVLYKFPQPESYYQNDLKDTSEKRFGVTNSTSVEKTRDFVKAGKVNRNKQKQKKGNEKTEEKKHTKDNWKKKKFKEKELKEKKMNKRWKRDSNNVQKVEKNSEKSEKSKNKIAESKHKKFTDNQNTFNRTIFQNKAFSKLPDKDVMSKLRFKKLKNSKLRKVLLAKQKKRSYLKKKQYSPACPGPACFNVTGHWVFKWAGGREEIRRHQTLGDWQFDRAKARKELRDDDYEENWQFKRAEARENNRNDIRWPRGKYTKYAGKDFFHEGFSWI